MRKGFTLAELLIALMILGVIATFTIPKVLQAQQDERDKARFKETYAALSEATRMGMLKGTLTQNMYNAQIYAYYKGALNWAKYCNDVWDDGCRLNPIKGFDIGNQGFTANQPGGILHNGVHLIFGIKGGPPPPCQTFWIYLDYNGEDEPNQNYQDQFELKANLTPGSGMCHGVWPEGSVGPNNGDKPHVVKLFE